eukprot:1422179-Ditylum_brightwellii.AAC.1
MIDAYKSDVGYKKEDKADMVYKDMLEDHFDDGKKGYEESKQYVIDCGKNLKNAHEKLDASHAVKHKKGRNCQ